MKNTLVGYKTKITGWTVALLPVMALAGYDIDPEATTRFISDFCELIAALYAMAGVAIHYFRDLADK